MYTHIHDTLPTRLLFLSHILFMLIIQEIHNGDPSMPVVHIITETRGIDDGQLDLEHLFFKLSLGNLDLYRLGRRLEAAFGQVLGLFDRRCEQGVDKRCLAHTRFAAHHQREIRTVLGHDFVALVRQVRNPCA